MWSASWALILAALHGVVAVVPHIRGAVTDYGYKAPLGFQEDTSNGFPFVFAFNLKSNGYFYYFTEWCNVMDQCVVIVSLVYNGNNPATRGQRGVVVSPKYTGQDVVDTFRIVDGESYNSVGYSIHPIKFEETGSGNRIKVAVYTSYKDCKVRTYVLQTTSGRRTYALVNTGNCEDDRDYVSNSWARTQWQLENPHQPAIPNTPPQAPTRRWPSVGTTQTYGAPAPQHGASPPQYGAPPSQYGAPPSQYGAARSTLPSPGYAAPPPPPPPRRTLPVAPAPLAPGMKNSVLTVLGEVEEYDFDKVPSAIGYTVMADKQVKPSDKGFTYFKHCKPAGVQVSSHEDACVCTVLLTFDDRKVELYKVTCDFDNINDVWGSILLLREESDSSHKTKTYINVIVRFWTSVCTVRKFRTDTDSITWVASTPCETDPHYVTTAWARDKHERDRRGGK